jgi:hypothetical protein
MDPTAWPSPPKPKPAPLALARLLWRQSKALPLLRPLHLTGYPLPQRRAVLRRLTAKGVAPRQLVQPGLVLAASAGHGHAPAAVRRTGRLSRMPSSPNRRPAAAMNRSSSAECVNPVLRRRPGVVHAVKVGSFAGRE